MTISSYSSPVVDTQTSLRPLLRRDARNARFRTQPRWQIAICIYQNLLRVGGVSGEGFVREAPNFEPAVCDPVQLFGSGNRPRARLGRRWQGRGSWHLRSPPDRPALPARFTVRIGPPIRWPQRRLFEKLSAVADEPEVVLAGGNLSRVVRVGDTVRRPTGPWTPMVHDLLRHIRSRGFLFAPEPLGIDEHGREILSFIPGETISSHPWPAWVWDDDLLRYAVLALAAYHRSVADFRPSVVLSRLGPSILGEEEIVCHNDFAPYNAVFVSRRLSGIIDWDVVCAGSPSWDLAFFAWHWVPLHAPSPGLAWRTLADCQRRLRVVVEAYGLADASGFVRRVIDRIDASRFGIIERAAAGDEVFARLEAEGHAEEMCRSTEFVRSVECALQGALD